MATTVRAAISVALLAGFYLLALGVVGGLAALAVWLWREHPGTAASKVSYAAIAVAVGLVVALWKVLRSGRARPEGLPLAPADAPEMWATVRALAAEVGTRAPDEIRLVPEVNAAVSEDAGMLGLRPGRRYLYVGTPLLQALTVDQMRSVLAHELGHYSHSHTRLGALTYQGQVTIAQTIAQVGPDTVHGWLMRGYFRLYMLVSLAVRRRQELEADQASVRVAGRDAAASALQELPVLSAAWGFYLNNYVAWGLDSGAAPADVLANFGPFLVGREEELAKMRASAPREEASRWDSHPPIAERVARILREPATGHAPDRRPASVLVPRLAAHASALEAHVFDFGTRARVPFARYTHVAMLSTERREADVLYRAAARVAGVPTVGLATVLDLLAAGRRDELLAALAPRAESSEAAQEALARFVGLLTAALSVAMADAGVAGWRHSWTESAALVGHDGAVLPIRSVARAAAAGQVAEVRAYLAELGVDERRAVVHDAAPTAAGAEVVAAVSDLKIDGVRHDAVLLDTGLVLVPSPGKKHSANAPYRLRALATRVAPMELAAAPGNRYLPFENVVRARLDRKMLAIFELTLRDGSVVALKQTVDSKEIGDGFREFGKMIGRFQA